LLRTAPHIVRPLRFVLPDPPGGRPWWMIRLGLLLYDLLARRGSLPRSKGRAAGDNEYRAALKPVVSGSAPIGTPGSTMPGWSCSTRRRRERGAEIATRTGLLSARRDGEAWTAELSGGRTVTAKMIVNAAGPWVAEVLNMRLETEAESGSA
jgi:glycerol-3-phosphate dehydrogenase